MKHAGRPPFRIGDEYDLQDLFHAMLTIFFDDIRKEEVAPSFAGAGARMDFFLPSLSSVVELKKVRESLSSKARLGVTSEVIKVISELRRRRQARRDDLRLLAWNQERVKQIMKPFADIARIVKGNTRTAYTEAGGLKIGRPTHDPEHYFVDTYSAIKVGDKKVTFCCKISVPSSQLRHRTARLNCIVSDIHRPFAFRTRARQQ
jgi:hypothetical protein